MTEFVPCTRYIESAVYPSRQWFVSIWQWCYDMPCYNALPAVVGAWQYLGGGLLSSASGSKFIGKDMMQQAHVHAPAKRLMPMIKLGEMLTTRKSWGPWKLICVFLKSCYYSTGSGARKRQTTR